MTAVPHADNSEGMLSGYRVLDLCDETGSLCTKLMAVLRDEAIVVEPPRDTPAHFITISPTRKKPLFLGLLPNKRSVTLNLETSDGQALFNSLVTRGQI
jgi:crotonobetainyl-CoA:carnitine CoA-transferase CaiB-like acyl-CoA transferase